VVSDSVRWEGKRGRCGQPLHPVRRPPPPLLRGVAVVALHLKAARPAKKGSTRRHGGSDGSAYTGLGGGAWLALKAASHVGRDASGALIAHVHSLLDAATPLVAGDVTWAQGLPGVLAMRAAAFHLTGDAGERDAAIGELARFGCSASLRDAGLPCEWLYGRAGYLAAVAQAHAHCPGGATVPSAVTAAVVGDVLRIGRAVAAQYKAAALVAGDTSPLPPLMYEWHGKAYLGAAHGVAGIMHVLLRFELAPTDQADVLATLDWLMTQRFAGGNLPSSLGSDRDRLVHWCHGASGAAIVFAAAFTRTGERRYLDAARQFVDVVWERGLLRKLSICHGVAAGIYSQLAVWRACRSAGGDAELAARSLHRARQFAAFLLWGPSGVPDKPVSAEGGAGGGADSPYWEWLVDAGHMHGGDAPLSLFEGAAGVAAAMLEVGYCSAEEGSGEVAAGGGGAVEGRGQIFGFPGFECTR